ncbi:NUDIX hydrolase [Hyphococcus sp.]|uniref:NUDIX hydrolase n=1 Tax=Hyphococcus sp. TaxID=2038636 RepID=UPI003CCBF4C8
MKKLLLAGVAMMVLGCSSENDAETVAPDISRETAKQTPPETDDSIRREAERAMSDPDFFDGAWSEEKAAPILDKTMRLHLDFAEAQLTDGERAAVNELLAAGERLHALYLEQKHAQARRAEAALQNAQGRQHLKDLFWIMKGPVATTLENNREAFLNVDTETPARNVYPDSATRESLDEFLSDNPEKRAAMLDLRAVVREASAENIDAALTALDNHPALDVLHPGLRQKIQNAEGYFALPYSLAYADDIFFIHDRLIAAADHVAADDIAFARFLRLRAVDLLTDNYDGGDAAWVTGEFTGNLNAQIGSYETYDDALYGVKSFFSLSLLQRDKEKSDELAAAIGDIQAIEDALPYEATKQVRSNIPVGVYNVVADFGQARGTNTATILPNEGHLSRQYGRTILIRSNILQNEQIFAEAQTAFNAALAEEHHGDLLLEGNFYRTLWHEVGHYLGPDRTEAGGDIDAALQDTADLIEEMKADLVSLFAAPRLHEAGYYTDDQLRAIYAGGILRVLQKNRPRRDQAYGTMQLIQWNWFLDKELLSFEDGVLVIDYARYPETVLSLLEKIIDLQYSGDRNAADAFVDAWTDWDENLHGAIASAMRDAEGSRYRLVTYKALNR